MKRFHARLTCFLEALICISFLSLFLMVILLVGLRYIFNSSITGANEIITILFIYTTAIGSAIAVGQRSHISINILEDKLSQAWANLLGYQVANENEQERSNLGQTPNTIQHKV